MGYLYLILSILCSLIIVHLLKVVKHLGARMLPVLTINYLIATFVALFTGFGSVSVNNIPAWLVLLTVVAGALFIINFLVYGNSVNRNGVGVSVTAMRLSLIIPVLTSIIGYHEVLNLPIILGLIGVFVALFLLSRIRHSDTTKEWHFFLLIILFLGTGISDAALKIFRENGAGFINRDLFMAGVFGTALLIGIVGIIMTGEYKLQPREVGLGIMIGVPNLYSSIFMIMALKYIEGAIAFSIGNILIVTGGTILGYAYWHDKLTRQQFLGIVLGVISIILMIAGR